jgi:hypothetical protein
MILRTHLAGSQCYDVGDEIWQEPLADVIRDEADMIASYAREVAVGAGTRNVLRDRIIAEMTDALVCAGAAYVAPDGVVYTLDHDPEPPTGDRADTLTGMSSQLGQPVVEQVVRFDTLPLDQGAMRRAVVRWSNGSESRTRMGTQESTVNCDRVGAPVVAARRYTMTGGWSRACLDR